MFGGSWWLKRHHAHYFLIRIRPPSAKLLLESPDGVIKPLQLAQRSESSPKLWKNLWMPERNQILFNLSCFISIYCSDVLTLCSKCSTLFIKCPNCRSLVSLFSIKSVPYFDQMCPRERSWVSQWSFTSYRFLPRHFAFVQLLSDGINFAPTPPLLSALCTVAPNSK